jgi:hypothetical protein
LKPKNLKSEPINPLSIRIGTRKGKSTNIDLDANKPKRKRMPRGILSDEQKWRIYKSEVEPKLVDSIVQAEPNQMLESIKEAFHEVIAPSIGKLLKDTQRDNADLNSDIVTPSHIGTSSREKTKSLIQNMRKEKEEMNQILEANAKKNTMSPMFQALKQNRDEKKAEKEHIVETKRTAFNTLLEHHNFKQKVYKIEDTREKNSLLNAFKTLKENKETKSEAREQKLDTLKKKHYLPDEDPVYTPVLSKKVTRKSHRLQAQSGLVPVSHRLDFQDANLHSIQDAKAKLETTVLSKLSRDSYSSTLKKIERLGKEAQSKTNIGPSATSKTGIFLQTESPSKPKRGRPPGPKNTIQTKP